MTTGRTLPALAVAVAILAAILLLPYLTLCFIPDQAILKALNSAVAEKGLFIQADSLGRPFPLGISARKFVVSDKSGAVWLRGDLARWRVNIRQLLVGRLGFTVSLQLASGQLDGSVTAWPSVAGKLHGSGLDLSQLPLLESATGGGKLVGTASLDLMISQKGKGIVEGDLRLQVRPLALAGANINGLKLPDIKTDELRALLKLKGQAVTIDNLALQSDGLYLRLAGNLPLSATESLSVTLDLMPAAELLEKQKSLYLIMLPYQQSPGNYRINIGGTLSSPQLLSGR